MSAAEQFDQLNARIEELESRKHQLRNLIGQSFQDLCAQQDISIGSSEKFLDSLDVSPAKLKDVMSSEKFVQVLQEVHESSKATEKAIRETSRTSKQGGQDFGDAVGESCSLYAVAQAGASTVERMMADVRSDYLLRFGNQVIERVKNCAEDLKNIGEEFVASQLQKCGWPPMLSSPGDGEKNGEFWGNLKERKHPALSDLTTGIVALTKVQQTLEGKLDLDSGFWFMDAIVKPLGEKLFTHFATETSSTSDISKPQWLFQTAGKVIKDHGAGMFYFQDLIPTEGEGIVLDVSAEFMRCIQSVLQLIIVEFYIPKLEALGPCVLWLQWTEEAESFDRDMMQLADISEDSGEAFDKFLASSSLAAFYSRKEWMAMWCASEVEDCMQQVDGIMLDPRCWHPASETNSTPFEEEIWPPVCAENLWGLLIPIIRKSKAIPGSSGHQWLQQTGHPILDEIHRKLVGVVRQVEAFKNILEPIYMKKMAGCLCAARYFEHVLQEWQDELSGSGPTPLSTLFSKELGHFTTAKRKWSMRFGKAAAVQFQTDAREYMAHLQRFSHNRGKQVPDSMDVSPLLVSAIVRLGDTCAMFSQSLDCVCFREIWKVIAMAITRLIFNDIVTEAMFSTWGGHQLKVDCAALIDVFRPYTRRPQAHLKELQEACTLLTYPTETVSELRASLSTGTAEERNEIMVADGIIRLSAKQALTVLEQRFNN